MTPDPVLQTQFLRLSAAILGFTEADAFRCANAETTDAKEAVRATLQALVAEGKLRRDGSRYWRSRDA